MLHPIPLSFNGSFQLLSPVNQTLHSQPHATGYHHQLPLWVPVWRLHRCLTLQCWVVGHNAVCSDEGWASCASHIFHSVGIRCSTELRQRLGCGVVGSHTGSRYRGLGSECCFKLNSCFIAQLQLIINTGLEQSCNGSASGCGCGAGDSPPSACSSGMCVGQRIRSL